MAITVSEHHARLIANTVQYETGMRNAAKASAVAAQSMGSSFSRIRGVVGQAGYQIQDFAVQVQGGQSALTAFSQQGSQMLGAFGPAGAIAGAVLTVGILSAQIFKAADGTAKLTKETDALVEAQKRLSEARYEYYFEKLDPATQQKALNNQIKLGEEEEARLRRRMAAGEEIRNALSRLGRMDALRPGNVKDFGFQPGAGVFGRDALAKFLDEQRDLNAKQVAEIETKRIELRTQLERIQKETAKSEEETAEKADKKQQERAQKRADFLYDLAKRNLAARSAFEDAAAEREAKRDQDGHKIAEEQAEKHQARLDAIFGRDANDYQKRGLQLGAAMADPFSMRSNRTAPPPLEFVRPSPVVIAPNSAGREDAKVIAPLLRSIDLGIKNLNRKETALA